MLSVGQMQAILSAVTYRPGWTLTIEDEDWEGPVLWIECTVKNSYSPGEEVDLRIESQVPPMPSDDALLRWLQWRLMQIEKHECREWFRVDKRPYSDPHAERMSPKQRATLNDPGSSSLTVGRRQLAFGTLNSQYVSPEATQPR